MHVTDWLPTILGFANIDYHPAEDFKLDGFDQSKAIVAGEAANPREFLLYNAIINVEGKELEPETNAPVAVRNYKYKLIHSFTSNPSALWYVNYERGEGDSDVSCPQSQSMAGEFKKMLFDLLNDPNETTDLYGNLDVKNEQALLYKHISNLQSKMAKASYNSPTVQVLASWNENNYFVQPWKNPDPSIPSHSYPSLCSKTDSVFSPTYKTK